MSNNIQKNNNKLLSIIIPVYFNEESIPLLYEEFCKIEKQLSERKIDMELIFIDDGSGDNSLNALFNLKTKNSNIKIIKHTRNFGSVAAIKTGIKFVTGDCFTFIAADLQDPVKVILEMTEQWLAGHKYVIAVRRSRSDPVITKIFAFFYYKLLRVFVSKHYPSGGFDVILADSKLISFYKNSSKNINISLLGHWLGFKPKIIMYDRLARKFGKSRWTLKKRIGLFLDSILGFSVLPIRMILGLGVLVSSFSLFYFFWIIVNAYLGKIDVEGFATIVSLISFFFGVVISMLGIIGEYIWRIFDEINKKPESIIDETYL